MTAPWLIPTKLAAPDVPAGVFPRALDPAPALTLVVAGPGFGKTVALAAWSAEAAAGGAVPVWYAADPGDGDVGTFFHYMVAGVRGVIPGFGTEIEAMLAADVRDPRALWARFFQAVADHGAPGLALAIDDAHHLAEAAPELLKALVAACERLPAGVRVALASRKRLAIGLAKLQVRGAARIVEPDALRLTPEEARALAGPDVPAARLDALDGWPLGVALLAAGGAAGDDVEAYVAEELVGAQPPARRDFMLRAALLDELTADACLGVFGDEDAAEHLAGLEAALLLQRLGTAGWRFPGYLAAWLREEAARAFPAPTVAGWHRAAMAYHLGRGADERALPHAVALGDWEAAAAACARCFPPMRYAGRAGLIARWLQAFPPAALAEPGLALWRAHDHARAGRADEALALVEAAGKAFAAREDAAGAFKALVRRADLALLQGDEKAVGPLILQALARQAEGRAEDLVDLHFVRGRAAELRGDVALMEGCNEAVLVVAAGDNVEVAASHLIARVNLFTAALHRGELARARLHADAAIALADERRFFPWKLLASFLRAHLDLLEGDREAAFAFLDGLDPGWADQLDWFDLALARLVQADGQAARGDFAGADATLRKVWAAFERAGHREGCKVPLERLAWLALRRGQPRRVPALVAEVYGEGPWPGPEGLRNPHDLAIAVPAARALHLAGDAPGALALIAAAAPELERGGARLHLARLRLFEAAAQPDPVAARTALAAAQGLIEAHGFGFLREEDQALWAALAAIGGPAAAPPAEPLTAEPLATAPAPGAALRLNLFGGFDLRLDGVRIEAWSRKKSKWAAAALAMTPRGLAPADLAEALGGLSQNSLPSIKMALSGLRKALEPDADNSQRFVKPDGDRYAFAPETLAACDVRAFEAACARAERARGDRPDEAAAAYAEALAAYGGELLPEAMDLFTAEREGYRQAALEAASWLAERAAGTEAEGLWQRAIAIAPCEEAPYLALMRHYNGNGRPERVRQVYWDHRKALKAGLGLAPSEAFEAACKGLMAGFTGP